MILLRHRHSRWFRHGLLAAALLLAGGSGSALAGSRDIDVRIDEAKLVRLGRPAAEIIVGNPSIADVTVQSGRALVVTGKSYGRTNLIVLDARGKQVLNKTLSVVEPQRGYVTLHRGSNRYTYYCAPDCVPPLAIGDQPDYFDAIAKEVRTKQALGQASAVGSTLGQ